MTRMKKLTSVLLAMTMAASLMVPVWAIERRNENINQSNREQDGMIVHTLKRILICCFGKCSQRSVDWIGYG